MKQNSVGPSIKEWKELYMAAESFRKLQPWTWMSDSDLFGIQNPQTGEIGYCCIMGQIEEMFALAVYLGSEGLDGYLKIQSGEIAMDNPDAIHIQKCLMASFEDRDYLEKEDLQTIKKLGLKFRGRRVWPQFRSYLPGYVPWYLEKDQAIFLTVALHQAMDVARRLKEDRNLLSPLKDGLLLVRAPVTKSGKIEWSDVWMKPSPEKKEFPVAPVDELCIRRIKKNITKGKEIWEVDFFYFPVPIREGDRPFFPRTLLIMDHADGIALHNWLAPHWEFFSRFQESLLDFVEKSETLPKRILISKYETLKMLEPITSRLNIDVKMVGMLKAVERFREGMYSHFANNPGGGCPDAKVIRRATLESDQRGEAGQKVKGKINECPNENC